MPALNFTILKEKVKDGSKRQTIRLLRLHPFRVGDRLYLYYHMRQRDCEKLAEAVCMETFCITIQFQENFLDSEKVIWRIDRLREITSDWYNTSSRTLLEPEIEDLAVKDGFMSTLEMLQTLKRMHPNELDGQSVFQVVRW